MKKWTIAFLLLIGFTCQYTQAQQVKPLKGTWINLPYQDVRNKYMNPAHVNYKSPDFWKTKLSEYAEMGLTYIVIMAVADQQKAFYPSGFMAPAYPEGQQSPVEAIMEAADKHDMKVFMSCGWAVDQDDNIRDPKIREIQLRIMKETAELFGHHPSFYGWYLPVEDSMEPILPDQAIEAANSLAENARRLTPDAKIMISPYGICHADMNNPKFGEQIKKLTVDIIAYQDEIGCVREPLPMPRMKDNFKKLGAIHRDSDIEFWTNAESFTWEKEDNSRESALIPAAFPRYLSQLVGASMAGAEQVISFSVYGILDKASSAMPIGQPIESAQAYNDFLEWKAGKGRWPLLEQTFKGDLTHTAVGAKVHYLTQPVKAYANGNLTDGRLGQEDDRQPTWVGFEGGKMQVVIDLKKSTEIFDLAARFLHYRPKGIALPVTVTFYASTDGKDYLPVKSVPMPVSANDRHDAWIDIALADGLSLNARYIKVIADQKEGSLIVCDEVLVNAEGNDSLK
jgi:hypothetical protein